MKTYRIKAETEFIPYIPGWVFNTFDSGPDRTLVYIQETDAQESFLSVPGQIHRSSPMGQAIYKLASLKNGPKDWLEVGTWNGLGTTTCILDGFAQRTEENDLRLLSFELDPMMMGAAQKNLEKHSAYSCVKFIQNKLISPIKAEFPSINTFSKHEQQQPHFIIHYDRERGLYESASGYVPPFAPQAVILDGGEYSGYFDWLHLDKSRLQWIFLDDTSIYKNKRVLNELLEDSNWKCLVNSTQRNGWALFVATTVSYTDLFS
jgi:hypothetical protein